MKPKHLKLPLRPGAHWLLVLVVVGYPMAGLMASAFNWDSLNASLPLRAAVFFLSLIMLFSRRRGPIPRHRLLLGGFALLYLMRLLWDTGVASVVGAPDAFVFFMITVVLPCAALWTRANEVDQVAAARLMLRLGSLICIAAVAMHVFGIGQDRSTTEAFGRLSFEALNPISLGHAAASSLIAALCMAQSRLRAADLVLLLAGSIAALITLGLAASRGPVLCLTAAALVYAIANRRWHWLFLLALAAFAVSMAPETVLWERFAGIEEDQSSLERIVLQGSAITAFLSSPVWGSAFVEPNFFTYPHNLFIETAMALGVVGLTFLFMVLRRTAPAMWHEFRSQRLFLPMLLIQYFIAAQLSGAIYGNSALWACVVLIAGSAIPLRDRRRRMAGPSSIGALNPSPNLHT